MYFVFACFTMCESHGCVIIMLQPYLMQTELAAMDPFMQVTFFFLANVFLMPGPVLDSSGCRNTRSVLSTQKNMEGDVNNIFSENLHVHSLWRGLGQRDFGSP